MFMSPSLLLIFLFVSISIFHYNLLCSNGFSNLHDAFILSFFPSASLRDSALSLTTEQGELCSWLSPVLVLPALQLLSCSSLTEPLTDRRTHMLNQDLTQSLLHSTHRQRDSPQQVTLKLVLTFFCYPHLLRLDITTDFPMQFDFDLHSRFMNWIHL